MTTDHLLEKLRTLLQADAEDFGKDVICSARIVVELYHDDGVLTRHEVPFDELDQVCFYGSRNVDQEK